MADDFVVLPDDTPNAGKKVRTQTRSVGGNTVHEHMFNLVDPLPAGTNNIGDVDVVSSALPTGAATETTLATRAGEHTTAASPHAARLSDGSAFYKATTPSDTQPVSVASLPLPSGAATEATLATRLADSTFTGRIGEVQASPTANTVLDRLKALLTDIVLAAGSALIGKVQLRNPANSADMGDSTTPVRTDPTGTTTQPISGSVTANAGTNLNTSALALESGGNLAAAAASLSVMDDWDESDRVKVNPIVGQAGVQGNTGVVTATTQRVVLATDVALPAGTNAIGKLSANDGVDIGDVSINNLLFDEDGSAQVAVTNAIDVIANSVTFLHQALQNTFTTTSTGASQGNNSGFKYHSLQVSPTGSVTSWDVRLEGSINGVTYTQILQHTNVTGSGVTVSTTTPFAATTLRIRCAGLTLGTGTNVVADAFSTN